MIRAIIAFSLVAFLSLNVSAAPDKKKKKTNADMPAANNGSGINWMTIKQVQTAMAAQPKKVWIDVYTEWCGWCKVMDTKTYSNKNVIDYINKNFYAVRLDAEQKDSIRFGDHVYGWHPGGRNGSNEFAEVLLNNNMSFPTSVYLEENFRNPQPIPGYQDVAAMEAILKYLGEGLYKTTPFEQYHHDFKPSWQP